MYPGIRYPSMCYSSRATKTVVFWFLLLLASLAICHHFQAAPSQWQLKNSATRWTIVAFTWFSHVFTVFTRFIPCFTVILPLSYHHISPLSSPSGLGHRRSRGAVDLPGPRRGLGAGLRLCHAALEQSRGWEVGRARHGGLDHWDWMMLRWCWYWSFS